MIVADSNLIAYPLLQGDRTKDAEAVLEKAPLWAAPLLWKSEFRNVLSLHLRKGSLALADAIQYLTEAEALLAGREFDVSSPAVLELALQSGCSAYDCEFIHLAKELRLPLVTSDKQLLRAFPGTAVSVRRFANKRSS